MTSNDEMYPVAEADRIMGCPETRFDGPYSMRCGFGTTNCHIHGPFNVVYTPVYEDD